MTLNSGRVGLFAAIAFFAFALFADTYTDENGVVWQYANLGNQEVAITSATLPSSSSGGLSIPAKLPAGVVVQLGLSHDRIFPVGGPTPSGVVAIPHPVREIQVEAFSGCRKITAFDVNLRNEYLYSADGCIASFDGQRLVAIPGGAKLIRVPDGVSEISDSAVLSSVNCKTLILPESLEKLYVSLVGMYGLEKLIFLGAPPTGFSEESFNDPQWLGYFLDKVYCTDKYLAVWQAVDFSNSGAVAVDAAPSQAELTDSALDLLLRDDWVLANARPGVSYALCFGESLEELEASAASAQFIRAEGATLAFPGTRPASAKTLFVKLRCVVE